MDDSLVTPRAPDVDDLEDLFENAPCGYASALPNGRISKVNRTLSTWLGHPAGQIVGRRFLDLLNIAGKVYYETHFAPLLRMQGFFNEVALDLVRADGTILPVLVNAVVRRDEEGGIRFIRITVFNASDRRRYEREMLEARRSAERATAALQDLNATLEARVAERARAGASLAAVTGSAGHRRWAGDVPRRQCSLEGVARLGGLRPRRAKLRSVHAPGRPRRDAGRPRPYPDGPDGRAVRVPP